MRFRATYIFSAAVALLVLWSLFEFKSDRNKEVADHQVRLFDLKMEAIDEIRLIKSASRVVVRKTGEAWQIIEPFQDEAEEMAVRSLLMQLTGERGRKIGDQSSGSAEYGLDKPALQVELIGGERTETLTIGSVQAFDGSYYLKRGGDMSVGDRGWSRVVEQDENSLRRRRILPEPTELHRISAVLSQLPNLAQYAFERDKDDWRMHPDPAFPIDPTKVDRWLDLIQSLAANRFVAEDPTPDQLKGWGLENPRFQLKIELADGKMWEVAVSAENEGEAYLRTNLRKTVYRVGSAALQSIVVGPDFFRDGKAPFQFSLELAAEILLQRPNGVQHLRKQNSDWRLENDLVGGEKTESPPLKSEKLVQFFQILRSLEAVDFPAHGSGFPPRANLIIRDGGGRSVLELFVGGAYKASSGMNKGSDLNFVRVAGQKQILGVKSSLIQNIFNGDFLK